METKGPSGPLRIAVALCAAALMSGACGGGPGTRANAADVDALPVLSVEQNLHVGSVADPDSGFSSIGSITVGPDDLVYVTELQDKQIRVYDQDGGRAGTIGREGDGPGEFRGPGRIGFKGDTLWVTDQRTARITLFSPRGDVLETILTAGIWVPTTGDGSALLQGSGLRDDGRVDYSLFAYRFGSVPTDSLVIPDLVSDRGSQHMDTVGYTRLPPPSSKRISLGGQEVPVPSPPSDAPLEHRGQHGLVVIERPAATTSAPSTFTVTRMRPDGDTVYRRSYPYEPRGFTDAYRDSLASRVVPFAVMRTNLDTATVEKALRDAIELPPFQPPISDVVVGDDGSVWLRRESDSGPTYRWVVLDPEGKPVGRFELPRSVTIRWARMGVFYGSAIDKMGIPWLVRYRVG